jgi:hypothetical protein
VTTARASRCPQGASAARGAWVGRTDVADASRPPPRAANALAGWTTGWRPVAGILVALLVALAGYALVRVGLGLGVGVSAPPTVDAGGGG